MAESTKNYVTYPWLIATALTCCGIIIVALGLFLSDLRGRLDEIKREFPKKLDATIYAEHLTRTMAIESQLANKVNSDLFNILCVSINEIKSNQVTMMSDIKDLTKTQQRVVQELKIK